MRADGQTDGHDETIILFSQVCERSYKLLRTAHKVYLCVLYGSQNKHRLFPYIIALTDWLL
jgi:hypothetical protein